MNDRFERIADWLQRVALLDASLEDLVQGLGTRLIDAGVPVARISQGRLLMHPVIGIVDVTWDAGTGRADWSVYPRSALNNALLDKSPFGDLTRAAQAAAKSFDHLRGLALADEVSDLPFLRDDLTDPSTRDRYPIYTRLAASGMTGYVAFTAPFGFHAVAMAEEVKYYLGATVSYATRRRSGFTDQEVDGFRRINIPLMAAIRIVSERFFVSELVEAYLGRMSGRSVLNGQIARGDVQRINCALFFSDMRGSTELGRQLSPEDYVAAVNRYFDCVAGAVMEHGGEVLKFIGDGLLAIFPFDGTERAPEDMCAAALSAAREAFRRRTALSGADVVDFGIALHAGEVAFGNVGTEKRLDFTAIGTSVAKVSRVEDMTRALGAPLLATGAFAARISEPATGLGAHGLRGFEEKTDIVAFDPEG
ncbi:adenylate/guanylate cyclase domain-containing protein [Sedimentitalea sp. HM32M-2]|uniref:adenylate/guanylate cyclase domain-containing protein n=1 Tax=Sedimentitalea sp. HM32M-2 TaxID=3351566 RepID=UPI003645D55B